MRRIAVPLSIVFAITPLFGSAVQAERSDAPQTRTGSSVERTVRRATVHVAPPTGEREADRASILAALERARPGDVVQFGTGTYLVGELIPIETPRLTMLGHANGTTLRGCDPDAYEQLESDRQAARDDPQAHVLILGRCGVFEMTGGHGTIRGLTFEHTWMGLALGAVSSIEDRTTVGGYLVENNVFRDSGNGVRPGYLSADPTVIRGNRFMNVFHAVSGAGAVIHVLDNDISVLEPDSMALPEGPGFAIGIGGAEECVIEGNRIEGHRDGIVMFGSTGRPTRRNVIRNNTISGTVFPLGFWADPGDADAIQIEDNLVERNRIMGGGVGIALNRASGNRIVDNTISGITLRDASFGEVNGVGLWLSPGSNGNEIAGNTFEDVASYTVVLEGDSNRVVTPNGTDRVHDLGRGNVLSGSTGDIVGGRVSNGGFDILDSGTARRDTIRYTLMAGGTPAGERLVWMDPPGVRQYRLEHAGRVLTSRVEVDSAGIPVRAGIVGTRPDGLAWQERFRLRADTAEWSAPADQGSRVRSGSAFYVSSQYQTSFDLPLLARALLRRPDHILPLLPHGTARLQPLGARAVVVGARSRTVGHYAVHGLDLAPAFIWLDDHGILFADEISILVGWEPAFPELLAASAEALIRNGQQLFGPMIPPARDRPLMIRGARLFDVETRSVREGTTILIRGDRIVAVGPDGSLEVPDGAEVIDAAGRTVLPGLWDMHVHTTPDFNEEMQAPLYVAAGVTTVRDLGSDTAVLASLRRRGDAAGAIAPRIVPALIMYGPGGRSLGVTVGSAPEAREAIDRFAALGYAQVKLRQPSVPPELVSVVIERARRHGMRVSGHVLEGMTGREAIESGYDEIQHLFYVRVGAAGITSLASDEDIGARMAAVRPGTDEWREFVRLLVDNDVVIDPTLAVVEESVGERPPVWLGKVLDRFPAQVARVALHGAGPPAPPAILREHWDEIVAHGPDMVRALHEAGVRLVAGTDAEFGGFALYRELELYVEAGIPAPEVLALATLGAARVMGMDDELGSIAPGKLADIVIVDGDPATDISDIRRVVTVVRGGRVYDPAAIYGALGFRPCCEAVDNGR